MNAAGITPTQLSFEEASVHAGPTECDFLALLMRHPDLIVEAARRVRPEWLFVGVHKYIYDIMLYMYANHQRYGWQLSFTSMSMLTAVSSMGDVYKNNFLIKTEGMKAVTTIEDYIAYTRREGFDQTVGVLADRAMRIDVMRRARKAMEAAANLEHYPDPRQLAAMASADMSTIAYRGSNSNAGRIIQVGSVEADYLLKCRLNSSYPNDSLMSLNLNRFTHLSGILGGLRRRGVTVCTARAKTGKTTFAGQLSIDTSVDRQIPTLYMDSEVNAEMIYSRSMSNISLLNEGKMLSGAFYKDGQLTDEAIATAINKLRNAPFYYINIARMRPEDISSIIREFKMKYVGSKMYIDPLDGSEHWLSNPGLVIYDWLKLSGADALKSAPEHQMLGYLLSNLQDAANENDLPVFALGQNNRDAAKAKKSTEWEDSAELFVGGSDRIAQFCTALMTLRNTNRLEMNQLAKYTLRPDHSPTDQAGDINPNSLQFNQVMHVLYNRFGPDKRGGIPLYFQRGTSFYQEMSDEVSFKMLSALKAMSDKPDKSREPRHKGGQIITEALTPFKAA